MKEKYITLAELEAIINEAFNLASARGELGTMALLALKDIIVVKRKQKK